LIDKSEILTIGGLSNRFRSPSAIDRSA